MSRPPILLLACAVLVGCGADRASGDSATRTEPSATEPGVTVSGYARFGVKKSF